MTTSNLPIEPRDLSLFYAPPGTLRLTVGGDRSYPAVKLYQAWPLSAPTRYLSLVDGKGEEIVMVEDLDLLPPESREIAREELARRYLTARVVSVDEIRSEFGVTYWHVTTERGPRDFVVQSMSESTVWLSETHLLIIDVDGNRFEFPNLAAFDPPTTERLSTVL